MKDIVYKIFGRPVSKDIGLRGKSSGELYVDKRVFYKRSDVQKVIKNIKNSEVIQKQIANAK